MGDNVAIGASQDEAVNAGSDLPDGDTGNYWLSQPSSIATTILDGRIGTLLGSGTEGGVTTSVQ